LVAVVYACNRWIKFLLPKPFTVFTDHKNLEILFTKGPGMKSKKLQRWIVQLQQFDFTAKYLPGKDNYIADFLSRDVVMFCTLLPIVTKRSTRPTTTKSSEMDLVEFLWLPTPAPRQLRRNVPSLQNLHIVRAYRATCHAVVPRRSARLARQDRVDYDEEKEVEWSDYGRKQVKARLLLPEVASDNNQATKPTMCDRDWSQRLAPARFKRAAARDEDLQRLKQAVLTGKGLAELSRDVRAEIVTKRIVVSEDGLLFRKNPHGKPVPMVPKAVRADLVEYFHTARVFQHQGYQRTYATMQQWYYWRGMRTDVRQFCTSCQVCRRTRISRVNHAKGQTTLVLANRPFQMVSMDLVGPLPLCSSGARYLLTIMDRFTRYVAAIPLTEVTARLVAKRFYQDWILRYGAPESLLADNGTQFTSLVLRFTCQLLGVRQRFSTIYHPECNGQIERWHRFLKQRLAIRQRESGLRFLYGDDWDDFIPAIVFSYNASVHSITGYSPFHLLYGRLPALPTKLAKLGQIKIPAIRGYEDYLRSFVQTLGVIRNRALQTTYVHRRALAARLNRGRDAFDFEIGELVYRRALGLTGNLASFTDKWLGPYEVVSKTEHGAYQLRHVKQSTDQPLVNGKYLVRVPEREQNKNLKGRKGK
jgi:transposase InsO family protein